MYTVPRVRVLPLPKQAIFLAWMSHGMSGDCFPVTTAGGLDPKIINAVHLLTAHKERLLSDGNFLSTAANQTFYQ